MLRLLSWPSFDRAAQGIAWSLTSIGLAIALPGAAKAATYIGMASASPPLTISQGTTDHPESYSATGDGASASAIMSAAHGGTSSSKADSGSIGSARATAIINYSFVVSGAPDVYVPVRVQAKGWAKGGGDWFQGYARLQVGGSPTSSTLYEEVFASPGFYGPYNEFDVDETLYLLSGWSNSVNITSQADGGNGALHGWAEAFADPIFTIDPAYADRFTLVGIPQATAGVPEPAIWMMMIGGFGAVGIMLRRRKMLPVKIQLSIAC